jgi:transcriptional regulator with XRE-family HTH domain
MVHALTQYRAAREMTKSQLAKLLGVSIATVSRWESDKRKISGRMLAPVSEATGIRPADLRPDWFDVRGA